MALEYATGTVDPVVESDGGFDSYLSGPLLANADDPITIQTEIARVALPNPAFTMLASGLWVMNKSTYARSKPAVNTQCVQMLRYRSDGTTRIFKVLVGDYTSSADIVLESDLFTAGQALTGQRFLLSQRTISTYPLGGVNIVIHGNSIDRGGHLQPPGMTYGKMLKNIFDANGLGWTVSVLAHDGWDWNMLLADQPNLLPLVVHGKRNVLIAHEDLNQASNNAENAAQVFAAKTAYYNGAHGLQVGGRSAFQEFWNLNVEAAFAPNWTNLLQTQINALTAASPLGTLWDELVDQASNEYAGPVPIPASRMPQLTWAGNSQHPFDPAAYVQANLIFDKIVQTWFS